jgi:hypothetical protein
MTGDFLFNRAIYVLLLFVCPVPGRNRRGKPFPSILKGFRNFFNSGKKPCQDSPEKNCADPGQTSLCAKQAIAFTAWAIGFIRQGKANPNEAFANPIQANGLANRANGLTRQAFVNPIEAFENPNAPLACPDWAGL